MRVRQIADALISVLLAPSCAACGVPLSTPSSGVVCESCWRSARAIAPPFFVPHVDRCEAAGVYAGTLREIIHAFKYGGRRSLASPLAALAVERCGRLFGDADAVVPVPLHRSRERERGFNQAALIARALPLPCAEVLVRVRATPSQTDLPADERRRNVRGAFAVSVGNSPFAFWVPRTQATVPHSPVLLDDVATTGATLSECAQALREAGAKEVRALAIARAT